MTNKRSSSKRITKRSAISQKLDAAKTGVESKTSIPQKVLTGPTYLTILRMILSVAFMILIIPPHTWTKIAALIVFIVASITDKVDGIWARSKGLVTDLGTFLDPLADKMLVDLAFLAMVQVGIIPIWAFAIILVRDLAIDGMRMMIARSGVTVAASYLGKLKTTVQMIALIVLQLAAILQVNFIFIIGYIALFIAIALTVISGGDYLIKGWSKITNA